MKLQFNDKIVFDDFVFNVRQCENEEDTEIEDFYSQVCEECLKKFPGLQSDRNEIGMSEIICGVEGCSSEASNYIDFDDSLKDKIIEKEVILKTDNYQVKL